MFHKQPNRQTESLVTIRALEQSGNHAQSMEILAANDMRALTRKEALARAPELIEKFKGTWFYLADRGISEHGLFTYDEKGDLMPPTGKESHNEKVYIWSGGKPLAIHVMPDHFDDGRFDIVGHYSHGDIAPVVVGISLKEEVQMPQVEAKGLARLKELLRNTGSVRNES